MEGQLGSLKPRLSRIADYSISTWPSRGSARSPMQSHWPRGTNTVPDFDHAISLTRLMDDLLSSSRAGTRKPAVRWPV
jgi:hypothetical protein